MTLPSMRAQGAQAALVKLGIDKSWVDPDDMSEKDILMTREQAGVDPDDMSEKDILMTREQAAANQQARNLILGGTGGAVGAFLGDRLGSRYGARQAGSLAGAGLGALTGYGLSANKPIPTRFDQE